MTSSSGVLIMIYFALTSHFAFSFAKKLSFSNYLVSSWWSSTLINLKDLNLMCLNEKNSRIIGCNLVEIFITIAYFSNLYVSPRKTVAMFKSIFEESFIYERKLPII